MTRIRQPLSEPALMPGTPVEVQSSLSTWSGGFRVAAVGSNGYRLCRLSDGRVLPAEFRFEQVRRA